MAERGTQDLEARRSAVRVIVTYGAGVWVFGASLLLIVGSLWGPGTGGGDGEDQRIEDAKAIFTMVLPIATGIITYWFASRRGPEKGSRTDADDNRPKEDPQQ